MSAHALVKSLSLSAVVLTSLGLHNPAIAKPDLSSLAFHPVPLARASELQVSRPPAEPAPLPSGDIIATETNAAARDASDSADTANTIAAYEAAIAKLQSTEGAYAMDIGEQSFALGMLLHRIGDQEHALEAFERSMHVTRVNLGLYSLEQVPVMRAIINSHVERGDVDSAHAMQEALFNLQSRHFGKDQLALVPALIEWADWNVNLYLLDGGSRLSAGFSSPDQLAARLQDTRLSLAYSNYASALMILQQQSLVTDERLVPTERKLAALNFMINREMTNTFGDFISYPSQENDFNSPEQILERAHSANFADGSSALRRAIAYSYSAPEPEYDYIAARMMELGDWYLLFDRRSAALDIYTDALEIMQAASIPQEEVERIMSPGMPVQTPDSAYQSPENREFAGFIDVEFDLSRFGMAQNPQIIGSSSTDKQIEKELLREIRSCKFRPKFVAGSVVSDEKVQLRYYYSL